jgi:hypothetical protein
VKRLMRNVTIMRSLFIFCLAIATITLAQDQTPASSRPQDSESQPPKGNSPSAAAPSLAAAPGSFDQLLDRVVQREHAFVSQMRHMHPLLETYIQSLKPDKELDVAPVSDKYFLGRLDMSHGTDDRSFLGRPGFGHRFMDKLSSLYSVKFLPLGFAQMVIVDEDFQKKYYDFTFVRREFLGEVRCLVIDVQPKPRAGNTRFLGRIWVEDQDYNIVRADGTYSPHPRYGYYLHFDTWRLNLRPGLWLPAYIYSEESDLKTQMDRKLHYKSQTRLWGYDLQHLAHHEEFTQIQVDSAQTVRDRSETSQDASPVEAERAWERQAEDNALERLQKIGLLAPEGDVDKVLQTVVNNLIITNNLSIVPEVRCRVLLTLPLESFTIGHTIVTSRGLIDVLPDEGALAMVLAHEFSHIALGHRLDTKFAFNDRMVFSDEDTFERLNFSRSASDEEAADKKALELLANSPYKDKLASAGLFLKALQARAPELKNLIQPHLGNSLGNGKTMRMSTLLTSSPQLQARRTDQVAALPLGSRIKLDPWSNRVELMKTKPIVIQSAREKMPFEVTPFFPYLTRFANPAPDKAALAPGGQ